MKVKLIGCFLLVAVIVCAFGFQFQQTHAKNVSSLSVAVIGGAIISHQPSHITIATMPEAHVALRIFYRCFSPSGVTRIVYPNTHANILGRYTWAWNEGAPTCYRGYAVVIVVAGMAGQIATTQRSLRINPLPQPIPVNGNPWGYTFAVGAPITTPPANFCAYFNCIKSFWKGLGYVEECQDLMYSLSGGNRGACSSHGGEYRELYSH